MEAALSKFSTARSFSFARRWSAAQARFRRLKRTVQRFEYCFELAWKTLKDYLMESGVAISPVTPRQVIKDAFAAKLLDDGQMWMDMLVERNLLAHTYDKAVFDKAVAAIHARYLPALAAVHEWFLGRMTE